MDYKKPSARIEPISYKGQAAWRKYACSSKVTSWHRAQKVLARVIPFAMVRPTASLGGMEALHYEAQRLKEFKENGIVVPEVLAVKEDSIILSDEGAPLAHYLKEISGHQERLDVLKMVAEELANLHQKGLFHGRPHIKDILYNQDGGRIVFLDLEENPMQVMELSDAQERDLWLFLCSCGKYIRDNGHDISAIIKAYLDRHESLNAIPNNIIRLAKVIKPLRMFTDKYLKDVVGQDVKNVAIVNRHIEKVYLARVIGCLHLLIESVPTIFI